MDNRRNEREMRGQANRDFDDGNERQRSMHMERDERGWMGGQDERWNEMRNPGGGRLATERRAQRALNRPTERGAA